MGFRTIVVKNRCKLEYSINYLVCRTNEETRVLISEISTLVIASLEVSITTALLSNLVAKNITIVFCDEKHSPNSQLIPLYGTGDTFKKYKIQSNWEKGIKEYLWKLIVQEKVQNQANNLKYLNLEQEQLLKIYSEQVENGDISNREGHAAKVYFNALFGKDFARGNCNFTNRCLDYGYSIILSAINREIVSFGYATYIGIHHIGETNPYNLSCDLMEPLRPLIDSVIIKKKLTDENYKKELIDVLNYKVIFQNQNMYLENAIKLYVLSVITSLKNNEIEIEFIKYEL